MAMNWLTSLLAGGCLLVGLAYSQSVHTNSAVHQSVQTGVHPGVLFDSASHSVESNSGESVESGEIIRNVPLDTTHLREPSRPAVRPPSLVPQRRPSRPIVYVPAGLTRPDLPFKRDEFRHQVVDFVAGVDVNSTSSTADCAAATNPYFVQKPGYLIGLWDDKDNFANIDRVKCLRGGNDDDNDYDDQFEVDDDVFFELDSNQFEDIDLNPKNPTHKPSCSIGFLLTSLTKNASEYGTAPVTTGRCLKLVRGRVDYDVCEQVGTEAKDGGAFEPYVDWGVECQFGHAAVGVKVDGKRVRSLRCCKLTRDVTTAGLSAAGGAFH